MPGKPAAAHHPGPRPATRRQARYGAATGYQQRLLPDVAEGRVLPDCETFTATRFPRARGPRADVTGDCAALTTAGLITATLPPAPADGEKWARIVPDELTERGEDALLARHRKGRRS